jgi:hypothetical protein
MFRFPLVLVTMHVLLLMGVVVCAGLGRFGPAKGAPPPLAAGKEYLVRNTAGLLRVAGHHGHALERYFAAAIDVVKHELHAPRELAAVDVPAWLERVRAARGGTIAFPELRDEVAEAIHAQRARRQPRPIHRWRGDDPWTSTPFVTPPRSRRITAWWWGTRRSSAPDLAAVRGPHLFEGVPGVARPCSRARSRR